MECVRGCCESDLYGWKHDEDSLRIHVEALDPQRASVACTISHIDFMTRPQQAERIFPHKRCANPDLFPKPNDGQHPQEQTVETFSCQNNPQPFIEPNQMRTPLSRQCRETSLWNEQIQLWTGPSADVSGMYRSGTGLEFGQRSLSCGRTTSGEVAFTNNHTPTRHLPSLQRPPRAKLFPGFIKQP